MSALPTYLNSAVGTPSFSILHSPFGKNAGPYRGRTKFIIVHFYDWRCGLGKSVPFFSYDKEDLPSTGFAGFSHKSGGCAGVAASGVVSGVRRGGVHR